MFNKLEPDSLNENVFNLIDKEWFLLTAGNIENFNTMTASWGGLGILWNRRVAICFVRPTRYTNNFMEESDHFTMSFFHDPAARSILNYCGKYSGRDVNKIETTGLLPIKSQRDTVYFEQADLILECRKIYSDLIKPEAFLDNKIEKHYPLKDYHRMYIGEIVECLVKEV